MANCVKIKMNEKVMMLRTSTLTVGNLAMIFKLGINQGIYIFCEEEEQIITPTATGFFNIEDYAKTYVVNGEPTRPAFSRTSAALSSPCNSLGIPLSYQRTIFASGRLFSGKTGGFQANYMAKIVRVLLNAGTQSIEQAK